MRRPLLLFSVLFVSTFFTCPSATAGIVVGHDDTDISQIPKEWINAAKADLHIAYNHTSHGSQLISGMNALRDFPAFGSTYSWSDTSSGDSSSLSLDNLGIPGIADLSQGDYEPDGDGIARWAKDTYDFLVQASNYHVSVIMWSWCNIGGHDINRYINSMEWLIELFGENGSHIRAALHPVQFVFMTGHANGGGEGDNSDSANEQIRQHCLENDRILFDFADLENYDPDDNYFLDKRVDDALYYDSTPPYNSGERDTNWASEYFTRHPGSELDLLTNGNGGYSGCGSCAHSPESGETSDARLNCVLKGRAAWALFAQLAGWGGGTVPLPPSPPSWLSATDGVYTDKIRLTWADVSGAIEYNVYYAESLTDTPLYLGATTVANMDFDGAVQGQFYYFWVSASNLREEGELSSPDSGHLAATQYTLSVIISGNGTGTVSSNPAGISCNDDCSELYKFGTKVTITATSQPGFSFDGWSGDCTGNKSTCIVTVDKAKSVTAKFYRFPWAMFWPAIASKSLQ